MLQFQDGSLNARASVQRLQLVRMDSLQLGDIPTLLDIQHTVANRPERVILSPLDLALTASRASSHLMPQAIRALSRGNRSLPKIVQWELRCVLEMPECRLRLTYQTYRLLLSLQTAVTTYLNTVPTVAVESSSTVAALPSEAPKLQSRRSSFLAPDSRRSSIVGPGQLELSSIDLGDSKESSAVDIRAPDFGEQNIKIIFGGLRVVVVNDIAGLDLPLMLLRVQHVEADLNAFGAKRVLLTNFSVSADYFNSR